MTGASGTARFLYDGDALVGEYVGGVLHERYVHGANPGADDPLIWYDNGTRRHLHADHQGSIVAVTTGGAPSINAYDAWGIPNAANQGRFQYTGQAWIPELGMYHYKARVYSPTLGRFLQTDPVGYEDQMNLYAYVGNDPMNQVDPMGTTAITCGSRLGISASCDGATTLGLIGDWRERRQSSTVQAIQQQDRENEAGDDERVQLACVGRWTQACRDIIAGFFRRVLSREVPQPFRGPRAQDFAQRAGLPQGGRNMANSRAAIAERARLDVRQLSENARRSAANLREGGYTRQDVQNWQRFYVDQYGCTPQNISAFLRSEMLSDILRVW